MSLATIIRTSSVVLSVAVLLLCWLIGIAVFPAAARHVKPAPPAPPPENSYLVHGLRFGNGPHSSLAYVWKRTDFTPWLEKTYTFNVSHGGLLDKSDDLFLQVTQHDPGLRTVVYAPLELPPVIPHNNVVGTMTLRHALDLLTQGTACQWEVIDMSVLSLFCTYRPTLWPETEARYVAELQGYGNEVSCLERYVGDPDVGPDADFDIPAGDAADTVGVWASTIAHTTCRDSPPTFLWPNNVLPGHPTNPIHGRYTAGVALRMMLDGSGLELVRQQQHWQFVYSTDTNANQS